MQIGWTNPRDWGLFTGGDGVKTDDTIPNNLGELLEPMGFMRPSIGHDLSQELRSRLIAGVDKDPDWDDNGIDFSILLPSTNLQALEIIEHFASENCSGQERAHRLCQEVKRHVDAFHVLASDRGRASPTRDHEWNIFGGDEKYQEDLSTLKATSRAMFLSRLSAIASKSISHAFAAPLIVRDQQGNIPYSKHVSFSVYVLSNPSRVGDRGQEPKTRFNIEQLQAEGMQVKLPGQHFSFSTIRVGLQNNVGLSAALAMSMPHKVPLLE